MKAGLVALRVEADESGRIRKLAQKAVLRCPVLLHKQLIQLGAVGYAEWQLTDDSGSAAPQIPNLGKDRVFALGPEFGVILPASKFNFSVRVLPEFGARSRTQGLTFIVGAGKSF